MTATHGIIRNIFLLLSIMHATVGFTSPYRPSTTPSPNRRRCVSHRERRSIESIESIANPAALAPRTRLSTSSLHYLPCPNSLHKPHRPLRHISTRSTRSTRLYNMYDDWSSDLLSSSQSEYTYGDLILPLDEDSIEMCLEEFMDSEYGMTMFGRHDLPASVGITGTIEFVSLEGPEAILSLIGKFWHKRETVLGKAALYLNARIPELTSINVSSPEELSDYEEVMDEFTGEVLYVEDKRSPDFNGDRETMEYQGLDPDVRGPFVLGSDRWGGGSMIRPA